MIIILDQIPWRSRVGLLVVQRILQSRTLEYKKSARRNVITAGPLYRGGGNVTENT